MSTCFSDDILLYLHSLMFKSFDDHMLPCLHALLIACLLTCMPSFFYDWALWWLLAHMFKGFDDCMLTCIDIHKFDIHTQVQTRWSWNVYRLGGISDRAVGCMCTQIVWRLCLNVKVITRLKVCVLRYLNAHMLVCSHDHILVRSHYQMLVCSHALLTTCSHLYLLW